MTQWNEDEARTAIAPHLDQPGGLMPALHALMARFRYIDEAALPLLADVFNLSRAEVHGVVSFYHDFRRQPPGRHIIKICQAEACQAMGARGLTKHAMAVLGIDFGGTTPSGEFTLEAVYCLGNCAATPAVMVGDRVVGRVDDKRFDSLLGELELEAEA